VTPEAQNKVIHSRKELQLAYMLTTIGRVLQQTDSSTSHRSALVLNNANADRRSQL